MKDLRKNALHATMFSVFVILFVVLILKLVQADRKHQVITNIPTAEEVNEHQYDEPKDYAKDRNLNFEQVSYYDRLYDKTE